MPNGNIIKGGISKEHLIEKYSFGVLNDDKNNDIEANNIDIIVAKNTLIKEHKESFSNATKEHMIEKRKNKNINHASTADKHINTPIASEPESSSVSPRNHNVDTLSNIEKKISDKIDKSLTIINDLKHSIDSIDTSNMSNNVSDEEKQSSYKQGFDDGIKQTIDNFKSDYEQDRTRLSGALNNIVAYVENANNILNSLENELSKASIHIANEVIAKEIENDSEKVALHLAKTLISEIKEAGKISLKVSPYDYDFIVNNFHHPEVEILNDISVAKGGVIILSDVENIDGSIKQRLGNIQASLES